MVPANASPATFSVRHVDVGDLRVNVAETGRGPAILLLHGWPHTWIVWRDVMTALAGTHRVIAPDLRGLGDTSTPGRGYDLHTLAGDAVALMGALGIDRVALVAALDLGAPIAWMLAARHPERVERLAVMEGLLGPLPGAEAFLAAGPPWWFGFHAVPELPEALLAGRTDPYIDWFLRAGTHEGRGVDDELRRAFLRAYANSEVLRAGFDHYRAMADNGALIALAAREHPPTQPVLALGGGVVGDALARQLTPITADLESHVLADCGHIVPADAPEALVAHLRRFLAR